MTIRRSVTATQPSTTSTGTSQTQWCTHETGDTSNPHNAVTASPIGTLVRRITNTASEMIKMAGATHQKSTDNRAKAPRRDWLAT
ncbi:hypothetical protein KIPE111705_24700 [Kibdelosporangium persicum]